MLLRSQHLQAGSRWLEHQVGLGFEAQRSYPWGMTKLDIPAEELANYQVVLRECTVRMPDGTWVCVPENTLVEAITLTEDQFKEHNELDIWFGVPQLQSRLPNALSIHHVGESHDNPRYMPESTQIRDENTGGNPASVFVRKMRGRLFVGGGPKARSGYEAIRLGTVRRSVEAGNIPEIKNYTVGPCMAMSAHRELLDLWQGLAERVAAKNEQLATEAVNNKMRIGDGNSPNLEHLMKVHALNQLHTQLTALGQHKTLHPFDAYCHLASAVGGLAVFDVRRVRPDFLPAYDHDYPARSLHDLELQLVQLLEALISWQHHEVRFRKVPDRQTGRDGFEVTLKRLWVDEGYPLYVGFRAKDTTADDLYDKVYRDMGMKVASPERARRIIERGVRGLGLQTKTNVPPGLPIAPDLHYFEVEKAARGDRDYWDECKKEMAIRMDIKQDKLDEMESYVPTLFVILPMR